MRLCKTCVHYVEGDIIVFAKCRKSKPIVSLVDGTSRFRYCEDERDECCGDCGPDGINHKERVPASTHEDANSNEEEAND